jgi:YVTN family beta-propeller protein
MGLGRFTCIAGLLASLCLPTTTFGAALGALEKTFNFHAGDMAVNPVSPYLYATIPATNSLAVINTNTLTQIATIPLGVAPGAITVSRDGAKVYISNAGTSVLVLDASTNLLTTPLPIGHASASVAIGNDNRLWVLGNGIEQVNATTGVSAGPSAPITFTYSGKLLASPDGTRLYYATYGLSPGDLYQFDVSGSGVPTTLYHNRSDIGENGEDLVLSNDGSRLAYVCGFGNGVPNPRVPHQRHVHHRQLRNRRVPRRPRLQPRQQDRLRPPHHLPDRHRPLQHRHRRLARPVPRSRSRFPRVRRQLRRPPLRRLRGRLLRRFEPQGLFRPRAHNLRPPGHARTVHPPATPQHA